MLIRYIFALQTCLTRKNLTCDPRTLEGHYLTHVPSITVPTFPGKFKEKKVMAKNA
jgi:hypothetical protein